MENDQERNSNSNQVIINFFLAKSIFILDGINKSNYIQMQMLRCECHCSIWVYVGHGRQALRQCFFHSMHCPLHNQMQIKIVASKLCNPNTHKHTLSSKPKKRENDKKFIYIDLQQSFIFVFNLRCDLLFSQRFTKWKSKKSNLIK